MPGSNGRARNTPQRTAKPPSFQHGEGCARGDAATAFLAGGGEMGALIAQKDWPATALGPIESWPASLRTAVGLGLASNFPINIIWGSGRNQIYNDGYRPLCGAKHPYSMGQDYKACWFSAWKALGEAFDSAWAGQSAFLENQRMFLDRDGYLEEAFFTYSFSPIFDENGAVGGLFHPVTEITQQSLAQRRLGVLRELAAQMAEATTVKDAATQIVYALGNYELDLPFALLYRVDPKASTARLAGSTGLAAGTRAAPEHIDPTADGPDVAWPLAAAGRSGRELQIDGLADRFGALACGPYPEPPQQAFVLPINAPGTARPLAFLIAGVSPRRALDAPYREFYTMLRETAARVLAEALAREREHERKSAEQAERTRRRQLDLLARTSQTLIVGHRTGNALLQTIFDEVAEVVETELFFNYLAAADGETLWLASSGGLSPGQKDCLATIRFGEYLCGKVAARREKLIVENLPESEYAEAKVLSAAGVQCYAGFPLLAHGHLIGTVAFATRNRTHFRGGELQLLQTICDHVSVTFERARAKARIKRQNMVLEGINRIFREALTSHSAQTLGRVCLAVAEDVTESAFSFMGDLNFETGRLGDLAISERGRATFTREDPHFPARVPPGEFNIHGIYGQVLADGKGLYTNDPDASGVPEGHPPLRAFLGVPFIQDGQTVGMMGLGNREGGYRRQNLEDAEALAPAIHRALVGKQNEKALRDSQDRLKTLVEQAATGVVETDAEGRMTLVNQRWCEMLGYREAELLGVNVLDMSHPDSRDETADAMRCLAQGEKQTIEIEKRYRRKNGSILWATSNLSARYGPNSEFQGTIGVVLDTTERKRAEDALRETDRRKDEFLATLAHELRNPLAPLRTSLDILRAGNDKPAMQDKARAMMTRQLQQLTRLVDDLLDVSRITRGKAELARERVALATVVEEAVETLRPFIDACGHELTVSLPEPAIELQADPLRLTQIVGNLLNNAAKYTSKGGQIMLAAHCDGFWAIITVRDNGVGLTSDQCDGVFDMFAQFDRSEQAVGGLGIGLTLVKQLVELHGGTVAAHSDGPGCGCEFTVRLPLAPEESEPAPPPASSGGRRILVADDNTDAAQALALLLELSGHEVRTAADGEAALSVAAEFTPEIVLLDIGMPVLDGLETAYRMRAEPWGAGIILVAVSGWGADTDRDRSTAAGFDHHLVKPVEPETLEALLAEL